MANFCPLKGFFCPILQICVLSNCPPLVADHSINWVIEFIVKKKLNFLLSGGYTFDKNWCSFSRMFKSEAWRHRVHWECYIRFSHPTNNRIMGFRLKFNKCQFIAIWLWGFFRGFRGKYFLFWLICKTIVILLTNHSKFIVFAVVIVLHRVLYSLVFRWHVFPFLCFFFLSAAFICSGRWMMRQQQHVIFLPITSMQVSNPSLSCF